MCALLGNLPAARQGLPSPGDPSTPGSLHWTGRTQNQHFTIQTHLGLQPGGNRAMIQQGRGEKGSF